MPGCSDVLMRHEWLLKEELIKTSHIIYFWIKEIRHALWYDRANRINVCWWLIFLRIDSSRHVLQFDAQCGGGTFVVECTMACLRYFIAIVVAGCIRSVGWMVVEQDTDTYIMHCCCKGGVFHTRASRDRLERLRVSGAAKSPCFFLVVCVCVCVCWFVYPYACLYFRCLNMLKAVFNNKGKHLGFKMRPALDDTYLHIVQRCINSSHK